MVAKRLDHGGVDTKIFIWGFYVVFVFQRFTVSVNVVEIYFV